ncbi:hypothetical protein ETB97_007075 [Aspergillus alliaceus]|uniref:Uncharacterized protein n=1 Tax=Petromyces alliaceus TaxID=209559 RepID=A0A8H5ZYH0_PETAA|nr:hypothetical protein ETB97_007075 [Aspergillus burnettii]
MPSGESRNTTSPLKVSTIQQHTAESISAISIAPSWQMPVPSPSGSRLTLGNGHGNPRSAKQCATNASLKHTIEPKGRISPPCIVKNAKHIKGFLHRPYKVPRGKHMRLRTRYVQTPPLSLWQAYCQTNETC